LNVIVVFEVLLEEAMRGSPQAQNSGNIRRKLLKTKEGLNTSEEARVRLHQAIVEQSRKQHNDDGLPGELDAS